MKDKENRRENEKSDTYLEVESQMEKDKKAKDTKKLTLWFWGMDENSGTGKCVQGVRNKKSKQPAA